MTFGIALAKKDNIHPDIGFNLPDTGYPAGYAAGSFDSKARDRPPEKRRYRVFVPRAQSVSIQMGNMVGVLWVSCSCSLVLAVSMGKVTTSAVMAAMPLPNIN